MATKLDYNIDFDSYLEYDESSPTGLRWKVDVIIGVNGGVGIQAGTIAGSLRADNTGVPRQVVVGFKNKYYRAHRIVYKMHHGYIDPTLVVDHKDGNPWNNKISNLVLKTHKSNMQNSHMRKDNPTGVTGLIWEHPTPNCTRIIATVKVGDKNKKAGFAVNKYGLLPAFKLAFLWRQEQIRLLNQAGENYTDRHGQERVTC